MPLIYITGPSGAGKSTIAEALRELGFEAHDADVDLCSWYNNDTNEPVEYPRLETDRPPSWQNHHSFTMSERKVAALAANSTANTIYICGISPNDLELASRYFSKVICLFIDEETMVERVTHRTNNKYGQAPDQLGIMRKYYQSTVEKYRDGGAIMIDASRPVDVIIDELTA